MPSQRVVADQVAEGLGDLLSAFSHRKFDSNTAASNNQIGMREMSRQRDARQKRQSSFLPNSPSSGNRNRERNRLPIAVAPAFGRPLTPRKSGSPRRGLGDWP